MTLHLAQPALWEGAGFLVPGAFPGHRPQDPAALTETSISHRARAETWLGPTPPPEGLGAAQLPSALVPAPLPRRA